MEYEFGEIKKGFWGLKWNLKSKQWKLLRKITKNYLINTNILKLKDPNKGGGKKTNDRGNLMKSIFSNMWIFETLWGIRVEVGYWVGTYDRKRISLKNQSLI